MPILPRFSLLHQDRQLAALAGRRALTQLAHVAPTTIDIIIMGPLGTTVLAAGGLTLVLFKQLRTVGVGLIAAVGNQIAAMCAHGEVYTVRRSVTGICRQMMRDLMPASITVATVTVTCGALMMIACGYRLTWVGQDPLVAEQAQLMLLTLAPGLLPCLWFRNYRHTHNRGSDSA